MYIEGRIKKIAERLNMGIGRKKRVANNFIWVEQLCERIVLLLIEISCSWRRFGRTTHSAWDKMDWRSLSECDK